MQSPKKGVEIQDLTIGTGEEATRESVVAVNMREFLRRGDEVSPSPLFGIKHVIDLGRRECIAGLRYGIPGMRVGGTREITISPHLAYGEAGIPGRIPANALLRCRVELLEIRQHSALLPQDWLPGKSLMIRGPKGPNAKRPNWQLSVHENGTVWLTFDLSAPDNQGKQTWKQIPIQLDVEKSAEIIREAIDLPKEIPGACVTWNSGLIDRHNCMVIEVRESGIAVLLMGVLEEDSAFRDSAFSRAVLNLTVPHFCADQPST